MIKAVRIFNSNVLFKTAVLMVVIIALLFGTGFALGVTAGENADLSQQAEQAGEEISPETLNIIMSCVLGYISAMAITGSAVNTALIAGIFRAGGDTKFGLICDTIDMWLYGVPLGFLAAFVLKLPVLWVYFLLCTDEFVKWPWVIGHYRKGEWAKNITRDDIS